MPISDLEILIAFIGLFLGFPHGTLDWGLYKEEKRYMGNVESLTIVSLFYLVLAAPYVGLWVLSPSLGVLTFLILTLLHWGHEDLYYNTTVKCLNIFKNEKQKLYYILSRGGMTVIFPLFLYHKDYQTVINIILGFFGREGNLEWLFLPLTRFVLISGLLVFLYLNLSHLDQYYSEAKRNMKETIILSSWFIFVPVAISIPLYLAFYHSTIHFSIVKNSGIDRVKKGLIYSSPYFVGSIFLFIGGIYLVPSATENLLNVSSYYLIFLSILTLPHTYITYRINRIADQTKLINFDALVYN